MESIERKDLTLKSKEGKLIKAGWKLATLSTFIYN